MRDLMMNMFEPIRTASNADPVLEPKGAETPRSLLKSFDISSELWREYDFIIDVREGTTRTYRIDKPKALYYRPGGETHRVVDHDDNVHCVPAPGIKGCILRWRTRNPLKPVDF